MTRTRFRPRSLLLAAALGAAALAASACGSRHTIRPDQGESTRAWKQKQRVNQTAAEGKPAGLDSEEAAAIQAAYRESLEGGKSSGDDGSRVMILSDDRGGSRDKGGSYKK